MKKNERKLMLLTKNKSVLLKVIEFYYQYPFVLFVKPICQICFFLSFINGYQISVNCHLSTNIPLYWFLF